MLRQGLSFLGPARAVAALDQALADNETYLAVADVAEVLRRSGAEVLVNYLPVGSQQATEHYARACLEAGVAMVNCVPVFLASDHEWARKFRDAGLPIERSGSPRIHVKVQVERALEQASAISLPA